MANMFVERGRDRQRLIAKRREQRSDNRADRMEARKDAANVAYMDRMAQRAYKGGVRADAANAMAYGESRRQYADTNQQYMTNAAQRSLMAQQGEAGLIAARSPEAVARTQAGASKYAAGLGYAAGMDQNRTVRRGQTIDSQDRRYATRLQTELGVRGIDSRHDIAQWEAEQRAAAARQRAENAQRAMDAGFVPEGYTPPKPLSSSTKYATDPDTGEVLTDKDGNPVVASYEDQYYPGMTAPPAAPAQSSEQGDSNWLKYLNPLLTRYIR